MSIWFKWLYFWDDKFYEATFYVAYHTFNRQGLKLQEIFIFIISGLPLSE